MRFLRTLPLFVLICLAVASHAQDKRAITLDEFIKATDIREARISPDGSAAVIATTAPDWKQNRFKDELLLWTRSSGAVIALTHSRHDTSPAWSPDGQYIAFLSDRPLAGAEDEDDDKDKDDKDADETSRVWLIPVHGGEAFPLFRDNLDVHAFAWLPDGSSIVFSATETVAKSVEE